MTQPQVPAHPTVKSEDIHLGDQKPSQRLRRIKDLGRGRFPDDTLRILWMEHLPTGSFRPDEDSRAGGEDHGDSGAKQNHPPVSPNGIL
uniref:Uncharacterized protein n=1 Tax=Heliothis virescens TaxID=7102 RepID=A0A2A4JWD1_HELVI